MEVTVRPYKSHSLKKETLYLIEVEKDYGLRCVFMVEIVKLPEEMHAFFYDQYNPDVIDKDFLTANFYDFNKLNNEYRYTPITGMGFTFKELRELVEKGLAEAIFDYITSYNFRAIVVIAIRRGFSKMYHKVLSENEQEVGYYYNSSYKELNIHVIEP